MAGTLTCISPIDGTVLVERPLADAAAVTKALEDAQAAQADWAALPVAERQTLLQRAVDAFLVDGDAAAREITRQMGRPIAQSPGEIRGFEERARHMLAIAPNALEDVAVPPKPGFTRFIRREPLGVVFVVAPWNYPLLTSVNAVIPALAAGNAVIMKHSAQTPLCAERYARAFDAAGLPPGVFQFLHLDHEATLEIVAGGAVDFVAFTGSVPAGRAINLAAADAFTGVGLELGGKDPAYVRADAALDHAIENLVDGVCFNSGQSCCGIERIYVHEDVFDRFVDGFAALAGAYRLGNPLEPETTLGPMVKPAAADLVRGQVAEAVSAGARPLIDTGAFPADRPGSAYCAPQVLVDVDHSMRLMTEENFGPVVGIMKVASDDEAVALMNDSRFGLTASVWTADEGTALALGARVRTGTWFMNRCDYLDPALAWTGVKESGRGCSLSTLGYEQLTQPKSFHLRLNTGV